MYCKKTSFLIVGMKKSGLSVSKLLLEKGAKVYVYDDAKISQSQENINEIVSLGGLSVIDALKTLEIVDVVVLSPGVPVDNEIAVKARVLKKRIIGEIELASYFITSPLVAVTGTNGKTTVCSMLSHLLTTANQDNLLLGNVGTPLSSMVSEFADDTIGVVEVSSFQLETIARFTPHIACILNVTPDHLDRHYNMENYLFLKRKLIMNLRESEYAVLNYDDENVKDSASKTRGKVIWFSKDNKVADCFIEDGIIYYQGEVVLKVSDVSLEGVHNLSNILAVICISRLLGINCEEIKKGIMTFKGVKHRIQQVEEIDGVTFYNDSKSTNPDSCIKAVETMTSPTILIIGGYDKGFNYDETFNLIKENGNVKQVVITGNSANKMYNSAIKAGYDNVSVVRDFTLAIKVAKDLAKNGYSVLFSPATSSFDLFSGYEERGDKFIEIVNSFK